MKIAYDIKLMKPGCVLVAAGLGADSEASDEFDAKYWLLAPTEHMKVYPVTTEQLQVLITKTENAHPDL